MYYIDYIRSKESTLPFLYCVTSKMEFNRESLTEALMHLNLFESRGPRLEQPCSTPSSEMEEEEQNDDLSSEVSSADLVLCVHQNGNNRWTRDRIRQSARALRRRKWLREHYLNLLYFFAVYDVPDITSVAKVVIYDSNLKRNVNIGVFPRHFADEERTLCFSIGKKIVATYTPDEDDLMERLGSEMQLLDLAELTF
jgi:hypothetical protein